MFVFILTMSDEFKTISFKNKCYSKFISKVSTSKVINVGKSFNIFVVGVSLYNSMILSSELQLSMPEHKVLHIGGCDVYYP